jgi:hypothetical protein
MSPEVEIRITVRDGTPTVGGAAAAQSGGVPQPDPQMGAAGVGAAGMAAPSPVDAGAGAGAAQAGIPTPMSAGGMAAAVTPPPQPVPLEQIERLAMSGASRNASGVPSPEGTA